MLPSTKKLARLWKGSLAEGEGTTGELFVVLLGEC